MAQLNKSNSPLLQQLHEKIVRGDADLDELLNGELDLDEATLEELEEILQAVEHLDYDTIEG
jgi:hypothetical protein